GQRQKLTSNAWQKVFQDNQIDYAIVYSYDANSLRVPMVILADDPDTWTLCRIDGHTVVSGWNKDAAARRRNQPLWVNFNEQAFGPEALRAPPRGPERAPVKFEWYMGLWQAPPPRPPEADDALLHRSYFEFLRGRWQEREA